MTLGRLCEKLEGEFVLARDNHASRKTAAAGLAADMEHHAGIASLLGWITRTCRPQLCEARTWQQLHQVLQEHGLTLAPRGNGLAIRSAQGLTVRASSIDRSLSRARLEARLGPYQAASACTDMQAATQYAPVPMQTGADTTRLYQRYLAIRASAQAERQQLFVQSRMLRKEQIASAKRRAQIKRVTVKLLGCDRWSKRILYGAISRKLLADIDAAHSESQISMRRLKSLGKHQTWADWLRNEAQAGDDEALQILRSRNVSGHPCGNSLAGVRQTLAQHAVAGFESVTKRGTLIYCSGGATLRDDGRTLAVTRSGGAAGLQGVLRIAVELYGSCIHVAGTELFREEVAQAAASARLAVTFDDAALEQRRVDLLSLANRKENHHGNWNRTRNRRLAGGGIPASERRATGRAQAQASQPYAGGIGRKPPPESQNRLRELSQLGMVRFPGGTPMLLPRDVSGYVEQPRTAADHRLRRDSTGAGRLDRAIGHKGKIAEPAISSDGLSGSTGFPSMPLAGASPQISSAVRDAKNGAEAAALYVFEREQRRREFSDIPKHLTYDGYKGALVFAGIRHCQGQVLALLQRGSEVLVVPVGEPAARRLARLGRGAKVALREGGVVASRGIVR